MISSGILEDNKIIALFMGGIYSEYANSWGFGNARIDHENLKIQGKVYKNAVWAESFEKELKYHSSWEWIMPVVEKICRMKIGDGIKHVDYAYPRTFGMFSEEDEQIMVRLNGFQLQKANTLIEATYLAIVYFIEYYNEFLKDNVSNNQS